MDFVKHLLTSPAKSTHTSSPTKSHRYVPYVLPRSETGPATPPAMSEELRALFAARRAVEAKTATLEAALATATAELEAECVRAAEEAAAQGQTREERIEDVTRRYNRAMDQERRRAHAVDERRAREREELWAAADAVWEARLDDARREHERARRAGEWALQDAERRAAASEERARKAVAEAARMRWEAEGVERARREREAECVRGQFIVYERKWEVLRGEPQTAAGVRFCEFPWPVLARNGTVVSLSAITRDAVRAFVLHNLRPAEVMSKSPKDRVLAEMLRFHPDKFKVLGLPKIAAEDRETASKAGDIIILALTELLATC
ncbi:hypothetical protein PHLGIDRAFT_128351 [Phlebiopsis gigantea 11061_1 CR5-6]|uniref:Uncharacterized protein n=1 Tax=Phlebiopsis gigantea (strain 11061_1 CR5-6) TaxID=745531 RepID=A0A0C3NMJ9_PHLG1|nr:hypothetical protein PHLGIDRAFT_128351 [Phlebiopsis gigantea 11061_1 CR5-6]